MGRPKIRNFVYLQYTRGFGRYSNEYLKFINNNGFSGFRNDSINGTQRLDISLESVLFSPVNLYGFRFAFSDLLIFLSFPVLLKDLAMVMPSQVSDLE